MFRYEAYYFFRAFKDKNPCLQKMFLMRIIQCFFMDQTPLLDISRDFSYNSQLIRAATCLNQHALLQHCMPDYVSLGVVVP